MDCCLAHLAHEQHGSRFFVRECRERLGLVALVAVGTIHLMSMWTQSEQMRQK